MKVCKICIITTVHPVFDTRIYYKQAKSLAKAGCDVTIIAQASKKDLSNAIKIIPLNRPKNRLQRMLITTYQAYQKAKFANAEIYHLHDPELLFVGQLLRMKGKKVVFDVHENIVESILDKAWIWARFRAIIAFIYERMEYLLLYKIYLVLAEDSYKNKYKKIKKTTTILNYPQLELFENLPVEKHKNKSIAYIGSICPDRGSKVIIEALKILKQSKEQVLFEAVGPVSAAHKQELLDLINKYELEDVNYYGYLPAAEAFPIVAKCHVGIVLLRPTANYLESLPTKLFEYMALGMPVIVSNFPLYEKIIAEEKCGLCVDPTNPEVIAESIKYLFENPSKAEEMGVSGRKAVKNKYNWDCEAAKLLEFYENICCERSLSR